MRTTKPYDKKGLSLRALHVVLGVVIFVESLIVALNYKEISAASHIGLPSQFVLALALVELLGALLVLIPQTLTIGTYVLLFAFAGALIIHLLHQQYNVGELVIYAAAVVAVMHQLRRSADSGERLDRSDSTNGS